MAKTTFIKDTGCRCTVHLLSLGLLLPSVLVSGQTIMTPTSSGSQLPITLNSGITGTSASQQPTGSSVTSNSQTSTSGSTTTIQSISSTTTGGGSTNGTTNATSMFYCPSFTCNYSDCYTMYISQNATPCAAESFCQLIRKMDMCYTASCDASCTDSCFNASQTNCSVNCCNSTGCLNDSFTSMMMMMTTTTGSPPTTTPVMTTPAAVNRNKCSQGTCTGSKCYEGFKDSMQMCSSLQIHCQLKKESVNGNLKWTAGCTTNCSGQTTCRGTTQPPCHLECCNSTTTSCLWLNGTLNVPSFATGGPSLHTALIAPLLLAIGFLLCDLNDLSKWYI